MTDCEHASTVEIYKGIFKCSACGEIWDQANDEEKTSRLRGLAQGTAIQERRVKRQDYYKQRYRKYG